MEAGLLVFGDSSPRPHGSAQRGPDDRPRRIVELALRSEEVGLGSLWLGAPPLGGAGLSAPSILLAALAERTRALRLGAVETLAARPDPLRLAEDTASLDVLSGGRLELALGGSNAGDAAGEDVVPQAVLREGAELLLALWTREDVRWQGRCRGPLRGITVHPRPLQEPHPPLWIAAGARASIELAAQLGLGLMLPDPWASPERLRLLVARYRSAFAEAGHEVARPRVGASSPLRGSTAELTSRVLALRDALGLDLLLAACNADDAALEDSLERFAAEVLPALRASARATGAAGGV